MYALGLLAKIIACLGEQNLFKNIEVYVWVQAGKTLYENKDSIFAYAISSNRLK